MQRLHRIEVIGGSVKVVQCFSWKDVLNACITARVMPGLTIQLKRGHYIATSQARVAGTNISLIGDDGVRIDTAFHYQGGESGVPIVVAPTLGTPVPYSGQKSGGWLINPQGSALRVADLWRGRLGIDLVDGSPYREWAPNEPAKDAPPANDYSLFVPELVPAAGITIANLSIGFTDPQADQGLTVYRTQNTNISHVSVDNFTSAGQGSKSGIMITGSYNVSVSASACQRLDINSSTLVDVSNSTVETLGLEECARLCTIRRNILQQLHSNDITCESNRILQNRFQGMAFNESIALAGGRNYLVESNDCDNIAWLGIFFRAGAIRSNLWRGLGDYSGDGQESSKSCLIENNRIRS